jgi:hypothetical protein
MKSTQFVFLQVGTALRHTETEDYSPPVRSKAELDTVSKLSSGPKLYLEPEACACTEYLTFIV